MRFIVGDVETSGLGPEAEVVQIAWAEINENFEVVSKASSLINPGVPISASASGVHGITNKDVGNAPTLAQFHEQTGNSLMQGDIVLVAHNAPFDQRFFKPLIGNLVGSLCTLKMSRLLYPDAEDHKLQTLRYTLGLGGGDAHSAAGDVEVCVNLLHRLCIDSDASIFDLFERSKKPVAISRMPFGKHKGMLISELPRNYVAWLLGLDNLDDNLRWTLNNL